MIPTPHAQSLLPQVREVLERVHGMLQQTQEFDPSQASTRFRLAASDYTQLLLMPQLCKALLVQAPGCGLDILPIHLLRVEEALEAGELDCAVAYYPEPPTGLRRMGLFSDSYVCIARQGHPVTQRSMGCAEFAALSHITVAPSGLSYFATAVDAALEAQGMTRKVAVSSPHFLLAAHLVSQSDMVLSLPRQAALHLSRLLPLHILELPMSTEGVDLALYWHERTHRSKPHQWLRVQVQAVLGA
jgi:DNA-binding transcriptional LysR family regulator